MKTTILRRACIALLLVAVGGCNVKVSTGYPGSFGGPGNFADFGISAYNNQDVNNICGIRSTANDNPATGADAFSSQMRTDYWNETKNERDYCGEPDGVANVRASDINGQFGNADLIYLSGHGRDGAFVLGGWNDALFPGVDQGCWGPGSNASGNSADQCRNSPGQVTGRTKWILAWSSDTASAPYLLWPAHPEYTANWLPLFGGSLHGLYGFWQGQGQCGMANFGFPPSLDRACDIPASKSNEFAQEIVKQMINNSPNQPMHQAWITAQARAASASGWAIWEDFFCNKEYINSSAGCSPSGSVWYYNPQRTQGVGVGNVAIGHETLSLSPIALSPEQISDQAMLNAAQPYLGNPDSYTSDGIATHAIKSQTHTDHDSVTGEAVFYGVMQNQPVGFDQTTAQNAAIDSINSSQGMPGDAVLASVDAFYRTSPYDGSSTIMGYEFVWKHSGQPFGTDGIRVIVDDLVTTTRTCLDWQYTENDPPMKNFRYCDSWQTTTTHSPNIAFHQRLWRQRGSVRYPLGWRQGQQSLDAATAAQSLPTGTQVISYAGGYWTPYANTGDTQGLPAWVFELSGGGEVYVDAYTGAVLGEVNE